MTAWRASSLGLTEIKIKLTLSTPSMVVTFLKEKERFCSLIWLITLRGGEATCQLLAN